MAVKQTAGRDALGEFAPKFAQLNDDVLFGEVWSREDKLSLRDRSLVTVVALMAQGLTDESFRYHLMSAKKNGITREEIAEIVTHAAFYCGWPKAWAVFRMAKEIWKDEYCRKADVFPTVCVCGGVRAPRPTRKTRTSKSSHSQKNSQHTKKPPLRTVFCFFIRASMRRQ